MSTLIEKLCAEKFIKTGTRESIYGGCKFLADYINGGLSKYKKNELLNLIIQCENYITSKKYYTKTNYKKFKFGTKEIKLDNEQHAVVISPNNCNIRIIAAAGTGKTTTILCRIRYLLDNFTTPQKILVLTFNVEACKNLKKRIQELFGFDIKLEIRTIDSFCHKIINTFGDFRDCKNGFGYSLSELCFDGLSIMQKYSDIICPQYKYVFFDEFQDVNDQQFNILKYFSLYNCYLTVIGDDNQNIYQFRGTNNYYIINFDNLIPNTKTYMITNNYRSSNLIVSLANDSVKHNKNRILDKTMHHNMESKIMPKIFLYSTQKIQYISIVKKIQSLILTGIHYNDIAILSRSNFGLKLAEEQLQKNNIPNITLITDSNDDGKPCIQEGKVTISTIHRVKGLEWNVVFIVGLADAYFPVHMNDNLKNIEEERRLFYVAVTRAKKYLYFITNISELPISRFICEIFDHLEYKCLAKNIIQKNDLFNHHNESFKKTDYSVTEIIRMLRGDNIKELKINKLIPDSILEENVLDNFNHDIRYISAIKNNYFEADFGNFIDRIITRQLMLLNGQQITDYPAEFLTKYTAILPENEFELYISHNLQYYISLGYSYFEVSNILKKMVDRKLLNQLVDIYKKITAIDITNIEREHTYPIYFMNILRNAYDDYIDITKNNIDIMKSIYYVSLCGRFLDNRRNLIYRDVFEIFMEQYDLMKDNINIYITSINESYKCKIPCGYVYDDNYKTKFNIVGEIDYINETQNIIVDLKCSESLTLKFEWAVQVLFYSSLLWSRGKHIHNLSIFNIMTGKQYNLSISPDYNYTELFNYIYKLLELESTSSRNSDIIQNIDNDILQFDIIINDNHDNNHDNNHNNNNNDNNDTNICIETNSLFYDNVSNIENNDNNDNDTNIKKIQDKYMVIDVETSNGKIIQIAYKLFDTNMDEIKSVNKYIKGRTVDINSYEYKKHKITTQILQEKGEEFNSIMKEFLNDMDVTKYIIGHNIKTDIKHIESDLKFFSNINSPFINKEIFCTMQMGKHICNLKNSNGRIKPPKLEELYEKLYNNKMINAHDANVDISYTMDCFKKLYNKNNFFICDDT